MKFNSKNVQTPVIKERIEWFLGFGFHKLTISDYKIRVTQPNAKYAGERYTLTLMARTESIPDFKGHEEDDFQKISFSPAFGMIIDNEAGIAEAGAVIEKGEKIGKGDPLMFGAQSYNALGNFALIARALGVEDEFNNIDTETVYDYIEAVGDLLVKAPAYAYFAINEKDSAGNDGKIWANTSLNWSDVFALDRVTDITPVKNGVDALIDGKAYSHVKNKYTYVKLAAAEPNDAPVDPMGGGSALPDALPSTPEEEDLDLPF